MFNVAQNKVATMRVTLKIVIKILNVGPVKQFGMTKSVRKVTLIAYIHKSEHFSQQCFVLVVESRFKKTEVACICIVLRVRQSSVGFVMESPLDTLIEKQLDVG